MPPATTAGRGCRAENASLAFECIDLRVGEFEIGQYPDLAPGAAGNPFLGLLQNGDEADQGRAITGDDDVLPRESLLDKARKRRFRLVHVDDFSHPVLL